MQELVERLGERWPQAEKEAAIWKRCADSAARGHLLVDLASVSLTRLTPLICLSPDSPPILPDPLPEDVASSETTAALIEAEEAELEGDQYVSIMSTFDASTLEDTQRERFLRNLRAVEQVLTGAPLVETARETGRARSTLSRLVQRTRLFGVIACVPYARLLPRASTASCLSRSHSPPLHPSYQTEHTSRGSACRTQGGRFAMTRGHSKRHPAAFLRSGPGLCTNPQTGTKGTRDTRTVAQTPTRSAVPRLVCPLHSRPSTTGERLDEQSMELYVITPDGIPVTRRIHAAVLVCVKTAAIMSAVLALGPRKRRR